MSKKNENKLMPKLRFPEFSKDGEWQLTSIGQVGKFYYGKSAPKWSLSEDAPTPCVRYGELYTKFDTIIDKIYSRTNIEPSSLKFSKGGEILVPRVGEVPQEFAKNCCYLPFPNIAIGEMISVYETKEHAIFYTHYFRTLWKQFAEVVEGQNVKNLYFVKLEPIKIGKPSYSEQSKISEFVSSIDDVIIAERKKLEALTEHKKGMLQYLFVQNGETIPQKRFKEFEDSGEWSVESLKNVFSIFQGFAFSSKDSVPNGVRWLKIADVGIQRMNHLSPSYLPKDYLDKYSNFLVKQGDYVIALTRPILNNKLKISKVDNVLHNSLLNQRVGKLISNKCIDFVYYLLQTTKLISSIAQNIAGSEPPNLSAQQIENIEVYIPSTIEEQQKIADTLSSIDELIIAQGQKLEALQLHKKGLLQGLFPTINSEE